MEIMHQPFNELSKDWFGWENLDRKACVIFAPNIEICKFEQCGKPYARNNYIPFEDGCSLGLSHSSTLYIYIHILLHYDCTYPLSKNIYIYV